MGSKKRDSFGGHLFSQIALSYRVDRDCGGGAGALGTESDDIKSISLLRDC